MSELAREEDREKGEEGERTHGAVVGSGMSGALSLLDHTAYALELRKKGLGGWEKRVPVAWPRETNPLLSGNCKAEGHGPGGSWLPGDPFFQGRWKDPRRQSARKSQGREVHKNGQMAFAAEF